MDHSEFESRYWTYYIFLENSFLHATRYVYLSKFNFTCYSYEFNSLLLTMATEVENVIKTIYRYFSKNKDVSKKVPLKNLYEFIAPLIFKNLDHGNLPEVAINGTRISISPFEGFGIKKTWWSDYNKIKHDRQINLQKANMKNVINALATIYCLDTLFGIELAKAEPNSYDVLLPLSNLFYNKNYKFRYNFNPIATYDEFDEKGNITHILE